MSQPATGGDTRGAMAVAAGPLGAHLILVGSWVAPPALLLGAGIAAGSPFGLVGALSGTCVTAGLFVGPPTPAFRTALCTALAALSFAAEKSKRTPAVAAAVTVAALTYLASGRRWARSESFYRLITETLRGREYYAKCELRGAVPRPGKNFFACHPHGCLSAGWTWNLFWNSDFHRLTGRIGFYIDPALRNTNPLFRMVCDWYEGDLRYAQVATKAAIKEGMKNGEALALIPGGFEDATIMATGLERTALRKRQGFVKYCLEEGYPITPVYTFGESDTFYTFTGFTRVRLWLNKYKIPMALFMGRWWLPIMPNSNVNLLTYIGEPLVLPQITSPTPADVKLWHGKYMEALVALFDKYKADAGRPDAHLDLW